MLKLRLDELLFLLLDLLDALLRGELVRLYHRFVEVEDFAAFALFVGLNPFDARLETRLHALQVAHRLTHLLHVDLYLGFGFSVDVGQNLAVRVALVQAVLDQTRRAERLRAWLAEVHLLKTMLVAVVLHFDELRFDHTLD